LPVTAAFVDNDRAALEKVLQLFLGGGIYEKLSYNGSCKNAIHGTLFLVGINFDEGAL